jgi:dipeptidyl aminopeptidase/acylaminoacyl peptidase
MASRSTLALTVLGVLSAASALTAQQASPFVLDIPSIMRGPETVGREPTGIQWTPDSKWIHFSWLPPGSDWRAQNESYRVRAVPGAVPEKLTRAQVDSFAPLFAGGPLSRDGKRRLVAWRGDLFVATLATGVRKQLTSTAQAEQALGWSTDDSRIFYRVGDNAYAFRLADGFIEQLTDIRVASATGDSASRPTPTSAQRAQLERDQRDLFQVIRDRTFGDSAGGRGAGGRGAGGRGGAANAATGLRPITLARGETLRGLWLSPSGTHAVISAGTNATPLATIMPVWITPSGYVESRQTRSKVGDAIGRSRIGLVDLTTSRVTWLKPIASDTSGMYSVLSSMGWNDAGTSALIVAGTADYNTRVIARVDTDSARLTPLETLRDTAWVGGPCSGCGGWLPGELGFWWVSEADGWAHVYTRKADGSGRKQLTSGPWEVLDATLSPDRRRFQMHTSEGSVYERHWFTMALDGSARTRYTAAKGGHQVTISPDGKWLADVASASNVPPELYLQAATPMAAPSRLTTSPTAAWSAAKWIAPEIVRIPASDGVGVPARIYRPEQMGATSNGAAVIFVHGAGYLHNVHNYWSTYSREYQFHHLLAAKGYTVLDLDYRGSAGYGRDWRTAIYRHMGGRDLEDHVDASRWLKATHGIDPERVGIYGGSYGGFITLMALFTKAEHFGAGAALRSVTDWAHYNHGYTAQILNEPQDDTTAYRRSSPIFFAEGLKDPLLMAHGMVDANVQFQDIVRLSQRLIELGKTRWELAVYPVEDHGFVRPDSWTDEYRRILELFDRWLPIGSEGRRD